MGLKITIITATWNSAATLEDTLRSVKEQRYTDIEHIIIDGASTDDTLVIAARFPHIAKICSEKDNGIYDAMNKGIALATGDIIGILNSDDVLANNRVIERIAACFEDTGTDAVYGDLVFVDRNDLNRIKRVWEAGSYSYGQLYRGWMPPHPTVYVRRDCYKRFGQFNTGYKVAADYDMLIRLLLIHRISLAYLPAVLIRMRIGGVSTRSFEERFAINKEDRLVWENNKVKPRWYTLYCKPLYKVKQFLFPALQWRWLCYRRRNNS